MNFVSINPSTGKAMKSFRAIAYDEMKEKLRDAAQAFRLYRRSPFSERAAKMLRAAEILESEKEQFARLMTAEMGKPFKSAVAESLKCAWACRFYAENAERFLADEEVKTDATQSYIRYEPLGPVLAVMPWNFPFWQVFRFAAPALMAGNVGLLKHASNVPQCALAIEEIFRRAGFPEGVFQTLLIGTETVEAVIDDERIAAVTLTGSVGAGSAVASRAGRRIKKTVLELGGSDPFVVMPSADLEEAAKVATKARTLNNGQSCIAAKRFIVAQSVAVEFQGLFVGEMQGLKVGDPMQEDTDVGPLATEELLKGLEKQVQSSVAAGARILTGGKRIDRAGYFYAPTVLSEIKPGSPAYADELFGPVASLFVVPNAEEAIRIANDTPFGLGCSLWTRDRAEQGRFIDEIEAGMVFVNGMVASDPRLPFGGIKQSGYGRELGVFGIREFVNVKSVWVKQAPGGGGCETE